MLQSEDEKVENKLIVNSKLIVNFSGSSLLWEAETFTSLLEIAHDQPRPARVNHNSLTTIAWFDLLL